VETQGRVQRRQSAALRTYKRPALCSAFSVEKGQRTRTKPQQTQAAASQVLLRETCWVSGELPRVSERCHTRSGALASNPRQLRPSSSPLGGKRCAGVQRPSHGNGANGPSRRRELPRHVRLPPAGPPLPGTRRRQTRDASRGPPRSPRRPLPGGPPRWEQAITSRRTRPRERRAAIRGHGSARRAEGLGSSAVPSAPRGPRIHRTGSRRDPTRARREPGTPGHRYRLFVKGGLGSGRPALPP